MATRKPLILNGAQVGRLDTADSLDAGAALLLNGYALTAAAAGQVAVVSAANTFTVDQTISPASVSSALNFRNTAGSGTGRMGLTDQATYLSSNVLVSGTLGVNLDDTTEPGWFFNLDYAYDLFTVGRCSPGANPRDITLLFTVYADRTEMALNALIGANLGVGAATIASSGTVNISGAYYLNGTQVLGARRTGWNAPSGTKLRGTFNAATATAAQTAQTLAAVIEDLRAHGSIGT